MSVCVRMSVCMNMRTTGWKQVIVNNVILYPIIYTCDIYLIAARLCKRTIADCLRIE